VLGDPPSTAAATMAVFEEAVALHLRLQATAEDLHACQPLTRACRGMLRDLARLGPRTVPQLARRRPLSRQTIQAQVNQLVAAGMAELLDNPDHARSRLVSLTEAGRRAVDEMEALEVRLVETLPPVASTEELGRTATVLRELRQRLEAR
jgi:DNA-binding MarR family transcriptional regulator